MPRQPSPSAVTSRPCRPSLRLVIGAILAWRRADPRSAAGPLAGLRPGGTRASHADQGVRPTLSWSVMAARKDPLRIAIHVIVYVALYFITAAIFGRGLLWLLDYLAGIT